MKHTFAETDIDLCPCVPKPAVHHLVDAFFCQGFFHGVAAVLKRRHLFNALLFPFFYLLAVILPDFGIRHLNRGAETLGSELEERQLPPEVLA